MDRFRLVESYDAAAFADYYRRNKEFHRPWSPIPPVDWYDERFQRRRLEDYIERHNEGREFRFGVFIDNGTLICSINLTTIERGPFQNGRFGYSVDEEHQGRGVTTENLRKAMRFAFDDLDLHRVEANIMPNNIASRRVVEKCGFQKIGYSPRYLKIAGKWEDHEMYMALVE